MRPALKSADAMMAGEAFPIRLGTMTAMLDPAGVLFVPEMAMLIVSDLHLEKASSFARKRIYLPPYDTAATLARLAALVAKYAPKTIVSLGDSFHDEDGHSRISAQTGAMIEAMAAGRSMVWVTGNHDPLPPTNCPGDAVDEIMLGDIIFRHIAEPGFDGVEVSGHYHPAARANGRGKSVRRNCFAFDGARLILPAFGVFTGGLNILDPAVRPLFKPASLAAYMLGTDKIYPIAAKNLL